VVRAIMTPAHPARRRAARSASLLFACLAAGAVACVAPIDDDELVAVDEQAATILDDAKLVTRGVDEPISVPQPGKIVYEVVQPETLARLEREGFAVPRHFGASGRMSNAQLYQSSGFYKGVADALTKDVQGLRDADPGLTTSVVDFKDRVFDTGWLRSPHASYDLVAVLNRIDRRDFYPAGTSCGEARFVYRLSYVKTERGVTNFSRMPMFFNVVYTLPGGDCSEHVKRWHVGSQMSEAEYLRWLKGTALDPSNMTFKHLEVNLQVVRMPSENKPDMGGHAEYFLRIYRQRGNVTELLGLENTPNVAAINGAPALKAELAAWIRDNVAAVDQGTAVLPAKFLANKATSVTTFGSARMSNKPFSQIFRPSEIGGVNLARARTVATPEGLLARLDDMTCQGCHQGRSVAGFHMLGLQRGTRTHPLNALRSYASPHYLADRERRSTYLYQLFAKRTPDPARPFSFSPPAGQPAKLGMQCIPDSERRHFKAPFSCDGNTTCRVLAANGRAPVEFGQCMPRSGGFAGLPCVSGDVDNQSNARAERLSRRNLGCAGNGNFCLAPVEGTPGGMCSGRCTQLGAVSNGGNEICAFGAIGTRFDACAATGNIASCIEQSVAPAPRTACDDNTPCREDYMCQRLEPLTGGAPITTTPRGKGFCNPTYFIFQMRLDGHPRPL
jgi:hypothetical protein